MSRRMKKEKRRQMEGMLRSRTVLKSKSQSQWQWQSQWPCQSQRFTPGTRQVIQQSRVCTQKGVSR